MAVFYIEHTKTEIEVYKVEAKNLNEATEIVKKNWNRNAPNIVNTGEKESFCCVNGLYNKR